jgi:hypothetical protein
MRAQGGVRGIEINLRNTAARLPEWCTRTAGTPTPHDHLLIAGPDLLSCLQHVARHRKGPGRKRYGFSAPCTASNVVMWPDLRVSVTSYAAR